MLKRSLAALLLTALAAAGPARAAPKDTADALDRAVTAWMAAGQVQSAAVAVSFRGEVVGLYGHGSWTPHEPHLIASLSKAITAVCVTKLIEAKKLSFDDTLGTVLAGQFQKFGEPTDPRFRSITIAQLLTHRSGIAREAGGKAETMDGAFRRILAAPLATDPGSEYAYSNSGYLVLGLVATSLTGLSYEQQCRPVLTEAGATGTIAPGLAARAPNGGWKMSAVDYLKFLRHFEPDSNLLGPATRQWLRAPSIGKSYSLGAGIWKTPSGIRLTHTGKVHRDAAHPFIGASYYLMDESGYAIVVLYADDQPAVVMRRCAARWLRCCTAPIRHRRRILAGGNARERS